MLLRYCRGLDRADIDLVRGAFHKDAWIQFPKSLHVETAESFFEFLTNDFQAQGFNDFIDDLDAAPTRPPSLKLSVTRSVFDPSCNSLNHRGRLGAKS